jgi:hypothetical protein
MPGVRVMAGLVAGVFLMADVFIARGFRLAGLLVVPGRNVPCVRLTRCVRLLL